MGPEFLWYVTEVLLLRLRMKWAGPLFLCEKTSAAPPLPPSDSPERTSVGAADLYPPSPPSSIHPYPSYSNSTCSFSSTVGVQRSFCLNGEVTRPRLQSRGSLDLFSRPPAQGPDERPLPPGEAAEREQGRGDLSYSLKVLCYHIITSERMFPSSFLPLACSNFATLDAVIQCRGVRGRK